MSVLTGEDRKQHSNTVSVLITLFLLVLVVSIYLPDHIQEITGYLHTLGGYGIIFIVILYGILGASPMPSAPLTILITAIYGPYLTIAIATGGNLLAALLEYMVGSCLGNLPDIKQANFKMPAWLERIPFDSPLFLFLGRMLPGAGNKGISLLCGAKHIPLWRYTWTTFLSVLVGAVIFSFGGYGLLSLILPLE